MYWSPYTEPTVIRNDQRIKLIPIQVITLTLDEPSNRAVKAAISVPSNDGESKANTGRPYFSQIYLALVSLFEGFDFPFFSLRLLRHSEICLKNMANTNTIIKFPKKAIIPMATGDISNTIPIGII